MANFGQPTKCLRKKMKKKLKLLGKITYWLLVSVVVFLAGLTFLSTFTTKLTTGIYVVRSASMQPAISSGSLILIRRMDNYNQGDIITFLNPKALTTHRVVEIEETNGASLYVTKGDANETEDDFRVKKELVKGKVVLAIPYLGYPINFTKTLPGLILVIVVPATIIVYQEAMNFKNDLMNWIEKRKKEKKKNEKEE